ncbi:MAG: amidase [Kiloniellales bacterium]
MLSLQDYVSHDAVGLAELVRNKQVAPAELVEAALRAIEALNPQLNAVITLMAEQAEAAVEGPLPDGPLKGVPFLLKDLVVSWAGLPTDCGSRYFKGWTRNHDSEILKRWKQAGLVVVGKTNTPELGSSGSTEPVANGATHNPWNPEHTPGGSSGGSAAAVAAGIVPAAHANDGGGSIRGPASCCGLVGLKPTRGRNPLGPDAGEGWNGLVAEHVVSRSVRDTAVLLDITAGPDVGDPYIAPLPTRPFAEEVTAEPGRLRIGFAREGTNSAFDPDCLAAVDATAALLEDLGHTVEEASPQWDAEMMDDIFMTLFAANTAWVMAEREASTGIPPTRELVENNNLWLMEQGRKLSAVDLLATLTRLNRVTRSFARYFETYDVWLTPTMATLPPELGHLDADMEDAPLFFKRLWRFNQHNTVYNATGCPAISLPLHQSESGLPVGIMLGAAFGNEALLLRLAGQLERARPWAARNPPVSLWTMS